MAQKITYGTWVDILANPESSDEEILAVSKIVKGYTGFDIKIVPDPEKVDVPDLLMSEENAMAFGNNLCRRNRRVKLKRRLEAGDTRPVIAVEGDSWMEFPVLIKEVVDQLSEHFNIACCAAAGDTLQNMLYGDPGFGKVEFMSDLVRYKDRVRAFLFSGAGNDIIGEDLQGGEPVPALRKILKPHAGDNPTVDDVIDKFEVKRRLDFIDSAYRLVIRSVRAFPGLERLPILIHGYDYPFPYPAGPNDGRTPPYARKDQWLGSAFNYHSIQQDPVFRRRVLKQLVDDLYLTLHKIEKETEHVYLVDCRRAMPTVDLWNDEIHGNNAGFRLVGQRFKAVLDAVI